MSIWGIVGKPSLVQKVYFPRDILVISTCTTALMMTALEFVVFIIFMVIFRVMPGWTCSLLPGSIHIRVSDNTGAIHGLIRPQRLLQRRAVHLAAYSPGGFLCHANFISYYNIPGKCTMDSDAKSNGPDHNYDARLHPVRDLS